MVKVYTVGMLEHNAKNDPVVIADGDTINGYLFTIGADGKADAPVAGASGALQGDNLYIALNDFPGDHRGTNQKIKDGDFLNAYQLKAWEGMYLELDEDNIAYGSGESYASITAGTTNLVAGTAGKFAIAASVTYYHMYFKVVEKISFRDKKAVRVQIVLA